MWIGTYAPLIRIMEIPQAYPENLRLDFYQLSARRASKIISPPQCEILTEELMCSPARKGVLFYNSRGGAATCRCPAGARNARGEDLT